MRLYAEWPIEQQSASKLGATGVIGDLSSPKQGQTLAIVTGFNPLQSPPDFSPLFEPNERFSDGMARLVAFSGNLGDSLFEREPRNFMGPGHAALDDWCAQVGPQLTAARARLCLRPHCRHVLSDPPGALSYVRTKQEEGAPIGLALAPADLIETNMVGDLEDHLKRIFETLGSMAELVLLTDLQVSESEDRIAPVPFGQGMLDTVLLRELLERCVPDETPIVLAQPHGLQVGQTPELPFGDDG